MALEIFASGLLWCFWFLIVFTMTEPLLRFSLNWRFILLAVFQLLLKTDFMGSPWSCQGPSSTCRQFLGVINRVSSCLSYKTAWSDPIRQWCFVIKISSPQTWRSMMAIREPHAPVREKDTVPDGAVPGVPSAPCARGDTSTGSSCFPEQPSVWEYGTHYRM